MNSLFKQRRQAHLLKLMKYWRLVFNDQFTIALFFMLGALAYTYAQWLKGLAPTMWWPRWILVIWFMLVIQVGRLATLIQPADEVFLLPQVDGMRRYLKQARWYSTIMGEIMSLALLAVSLPMVMIVVKVNSADLLAIFIAAAFSKLAWLELANARITLSWSRYRRWLMTLQWVGPLMVALLIWLASPWLGLGMALIWWLAAWLILRHADLDWRAAVTMEQNRMYSVYRFFNLFTDVPSVQGGVKRRRWAGGLINWLTIKNHAWSYLYARGLVRNTEVSGLIWRLTLVGMLITFFVPINWLKILIVLLFIYLVAVQLMPFVEQYQNNVFTHLYPLSEEAQLQDFQSLIGKVMSVVAILLALASLGMTLDWLSLLVNLVVGIGEVYLLVRFYFKKQLRKIQK